MDEFLESYVLVLIHITIILHIHEVTRTIIVPNLALRVLKWVGSAIEVHSNHAPSFSGSDNFRSHNYLTSDK